MRREAPSHCGLAGCTWVSVCACLRACVPATPRFRRSLVAPLINAMMVGEKATPMDEELLAYQNSYQRGVRAVLVGRIPRDTHQRLPCGCQTHAWALRSFV
jgi:hypothetical protein